MKRDRFGYPRSLTCQAAIKKSRLVMDPATKQFGRCGTCKHCWRLFVHISNNLRKPLPKARKDSSIAGFQFLRRSRG